MQNVWIYKLRAEIDRILKKILFTVIYGILFISILKRKKKE